MTGIDVVRVDEVKELRDAARAQDCHALADRCERALNGDQDAWELVKEVVFNARAARARAFADVIGRASSTIALMAAPQQLTPPAAIEFNTREYGFSHGHDPRGRGSWAFEIPGRAELFWHKGTYTEAKKAARAEATKFPGAYIVKVCS